MIHFSCETERRKSNELILSITLPSIFIVIKVELGLRTKVASEAAELRHRLKPGNFRRARCWGHLPHASVSEGLVSYH